MSDDEMNFDDDSFSEESSDASFSGNEAEELTGRVPSRGAGGRKAMMAAFDASFATSTSKVAAEDKEKKNKKNKKEKKDSKNAKETTEETKNPPFKNRQRVMLLSSRGITERHRHLLKDLEVLLPHARKDSKFDNKGNIQMLNELADLNDCNNTLYLEVRKHQDLYFWMSKTPHGPSVKFLVQNVHTMDELKLTGNCLKGSRPLLSFDKAFDAEPEFRLIKELLRQIFGTPKGHRKSKPFFDHVFSFTIADGRIWFRNYQMLDKETASSSSAANIGVGEEDMSLVEIGPRFVMTPIRVFGGSFGGPTLYENPEFVSPNEARAAKRREGSGKYAERVHSEQERKRKMQGVKRERTELDDVDEIFYQQQK